jgi:hypothetical protein
MSILSPLAQDNTRTPAYQTEYAPARRKPAETYFAVPLLFAHPRPHIRIGDNRNNENQKATPTNIYLLANVAFTARYQVPQSGCRKSTTRKQ